MALINVSNLTFAYDGSYDYIFENVNFQIDTDWKLGFTGRNGRGKTTFLNLLLGKYEYNGIISAPCEFEYFPFDIADGSLFTVEIVENICPYLKEWELLRELSMLETDGEVLYRPFNTLSHGERTKVLLAALFLKENRFLLIDEPTNHLDTHGRKVVGKYLNRKKGFILVSHDRAFLDSCINHVLSINKTDIEIQRGSFSSWIENKERRDNFELAENTKLKKEVKRLEKAAIEKAEWADKTEASKIGTHSADRGFIGHKAAKMMKHSKAIEARQRAAVDEKSKLLKNLETADSLKISQVDYHSTQLASLRNVSIFYDGKAVCQNISFTVEKGDRISICGKNGSGKSSVIKLICGENIEYSGDFYKGNGLAVSYVSQDTSFLRGNLSEYISACSLDESLFKAILRKLDFSRTQFDKDISEFSGGQKKKVLIAKSLCEESHLLVWDEPLNYIDVISRMQIEEAILEHRPTILFVEHDIMFSEKIATKTVIL